MNKILIAGIGNLLMGDDAFGPEVIKSLENENLPKNVELRDMGTAGLTIVTELADYDTVIFIDTMEMKGTPGTLKKIKVKVEEIKPRDILELSRLTVHEVGLEGLLKFSKAIGTLPENVMIIGCKPETIDVNYGLSESMKNSISLAIKQIKDILKEIN